MPVKYTNVKYVFLTSAVKIRLFHHSPRGGPTARNEGSIPFTRSIDSESLAMQCSKSAVESNWKNQSQEERRSGKRKSFQWEAPKKIPAEEMGITNRQLLSAFIRHPNEARPGSHPITT
jgi:hypothetical protein